MVSGFHTTGVYGTTLAGEAMGPIFILTSSAKQPENYKIDPRVFKGLPVVTASYGSGVMSSHYSQIAVRKKGSMDTGLWHQLINAYKLHYEGRISKVPVRDPLTQKLISGPLIIKTDAGPGRLSNELESI